ncbi:MAG: hypothetical protein QOD41_752 [Cryptosporangiaceae bacterium]|nr:hypothetical protein [Cryptosporangiaceae bacterium]
MTRPGSPEAHEPGDQPFDHLPYPARMRAWAQHARGLAEPDYRLLHARLADRHLALHLAVARRDGPALERALADPALRRRPRCGSGSGIRRPERLLGHADPDVREAARARFPDPD